MMAKSDDDIPVVNLDDSRVGANWTRILEARFQGTVHHDDPKASKKDRAKARIRQQRRMDQERG